MKTYKEIKVNDIEDIEIGDVILFESDKVFGLVIGSGHTFLHDHFYLKIISTYDDGCYITHKYYAGDFKGLITILRPNKNEKS